MPLTSCSDKLSLIFHKTSATVCTHATEVI